MSDSKELAVKQTGHVSTNLAPRRGFEDEQAGDIMFPRAKVVQPTSGELTDERYADLNIKGGNIINSLTKEVLSDKFVPLYKFNNAVLWIPKKAGGGMACRSNDAVTGTVLDATKWGKWVENGNTYEIPYSVTNGQVIQCASCPHSIWKGDVAPICTKSMNFLAMFEGMAFPLVLAFKSTSLKHGKKLYSMAKMMPGDMYNYQYSLKSFRRSTEKGTFFETDVFPAGKTSAEKIEEFASMYEMFRCIAVKFDDDDEQAANANNFQNSVTNEM